jgi:hypothetical protein
MSHIALSNTKITLLPLSSHPKRQRVANHGITEMLIADQETIVRIHRDCTV